MIRKFALTCLALAAISSSALAQTVVYYREGQSVDPQEVAKILNTHVVKTRSLKLINEPEPAKALSLPVHFTFDSATISPAARPQLDALAAGIKMLPAGQTVVIEGHTDAVGTETYNMELSQRRAAAVKSYLVSMHGIPADRLRDVGFGLLRPIEGSDPVAAENRRVQFHGQ
jgi:outer membrane protein OmpA-like peptidoglycan-associated protein